MVNSLIITIYNYAKGENKYAVSKGALHPQIAQYDPSGDQIDVQADNVVG